MYKSLKQFFSFFNSSLFFKNLFFFFFLCWRGIFFNFLLMCFLVLYFFYSFIFFKRFVARSFGYYFVSLLNLSWNYLRMHMTIRTYFFGVITWKREQKNRAMLKSFGRVWNIIRLPCYGGDVMRTVVVSEVFYVGWYLRHYMLQLGCKSMNITTGKIIIKVFLSIRIFTHILI